MQNKNIVGYQIYLRSFFDGGTTGNGNIKGLIEKLDYLHNLGVNLIWLCPIYKSDMIDAGYDITDFFKIYHKYGTLNDFKRLVTKAKKLGIEIMMDLVINHISTNSKLFQKAKLSKAAQEYDFFIWKDNPDITQQSYFGETAWQYNEKTKSYYLHLFASNQADLNWDNPKVRIWMQEIIVFWAKQGVKYFRLDAFEHIGKTIKPFVIKYGKHHYEYMHELAEKVFWPYKLKVFAEAWSLTKSIAKKFTNSKNKIVEGFFYSGLHDLDWRNKYAAFAPVKNKPVFKDLQNLYKYIEYGGVFINSWSNHDTPRAISRYFPDVSDSLHFYAQSLMFMFLFTNKGLPFIFQGEEFGMLKPEYNSLDEYPDYTIKDQFSGRVLKRKELTTEEFIKAAKSGARALSRSPLYWDNNKKYGGFSKGVPWVKLGQKIVNPNQVSDFKKEFSISRFLTELILFRKSFKGSMLTSYKSFNIVEFNNKKGIVEIIKNKKIWRLEFNFSKRKIKRVESPKEKLIKSNYQKSISNYLFPYEARIYEKK
ncbi:alpha-amylase family glycosyl hydrolase [[Mycoplasma] testudinis]|uniref:alpha-amylase family glycosyl hydrolase n=1 Tax=[Mycoplasma] testudinis TaxID=33924 RepID=UPI00048947C9|nr:alpha-amylase family glycosyl hydrolase [[Mycoplasma] testudinis]